MEGVLKISADAESFYYTVKCAAGKHRFAFPREWASATYWNGFCNFIPGSRVKCDRFSARYDGKTILFTIFTAGGLQVLVPVTDEMRRQMVSWGYRNL